mgnify:FL=1
MHFIIQSSLMNEITDLYERKTLFDSILLKNFKYIKATHEFHKNTPTGNLYI